MNLFRIGSSVTGAFILLAMAGGCAAIPLSALSSLGSLGDSSVSVGRDVYSFGRLKSAELADFWAAEDAARMAARDLGMHQTQVPTVSDDGAELNMAFADDLGAQVGVRIERRTAKLLFLREDVGFIASFFGAEITDRLFLFHLRQHLPAEAKAATRPATEPVPTGPTTTTASAYHRPRHPSGVLIP